MYSSFANSLEDHSLFKAGLGGGAADGGGVRFMIFAGVRIVPSVCTSPDANTCVLFVTMAVTGVVLRSVKSAFGVFGTSGAS